MRRLMATWRNLFRKSEVDGLLDDELRSYRQLVEDEKAAAGADPETARREAAIEMGGIEATKEQVRDVRRGALLDGMWAELRQSARGLRRNPGMTAMCAVMLALGIGASTAIFSVYQAALLRPLPFRNMDRLVEVFSSRLDRGMSSVALSEADFWDVHDRAKSLAAVAAYHSDEANVTGDGEPVKISAPRVTTGFLRTLGVSPILGRDFSPDEERSNVALVGNKFWRTRYGADPGLLGRAVRLNGSSYTVIGVLPPGEPWIDDDVYLPLARPANANRGSWEFSAVARLKAGVTAEAARNELQQLAGALQQEHPRDDKGIGFDFLPSSRWIAPETTGTALRILLAAVGLLVLIACGNVANLLLARGLARQREIAVRTALGAGRARLVRFVVIESLLLSAVGAGLGLALAAVCVRLLRGLEVPAIPRLDQASLNPWVLGFAFAVTLLTGLLCGLAPALQAPVLGIATALREGERQAGSSRRQGRVRAALVAAEVALAFLLLVSTGLVLRSFEGLLTQQRGFQTAHRLVFSLSYPGSYGGNGRAKEFIDEFLGRLSATPGVVAGGAVGVRPVEGPNYGMGIAAAGNGRDTASPPWAGWRVITPGYLPAVGLPLLRGRNFNAADKPVWNDHGVPPPRRTVMVSSALAKALFPNEDPVGRHALLWKGQGDLDAEIVGVVGDSLERGLDHGPAFTVYMPYGRMAVPTEFVLQTKGDPMSVLPSVRALVRSLDPNLPLGDVRTFDDVVSRSVAPQRMNSVVLGTFSGFALLLASLGIYGVLSYSVSRRSAEIGLRMALGASRWGILRLVAGQGLVPVLGGMIVGATIACWLSRYLKSLLFGVQPIDPLTYAGVAVLLLGTAALACFVPGQRAMKTDPAVALRLE